MKALKDSRVALLTGLGLLAAGLCLWGYADLIKYRDHVIVHVKTVPLTVSVGLMGLGALITILSTVGTPLANLFAAARGKYQAPRGSGS